MGIPVHDKMQKGRQYKKMAAQYAKPTGKNPSIRLLQPGARGKPPGYLAVSFLAVRQQQEPSSTCARQKRILAAYPSRVHALISMVALCWQDGVP